MRIPLDYIFYIKKKNDDSVMNMCACMCVGGRGGGVRMCVRLVDLLFKPSYNLNVDLNPYK